ncbi:hypothetical protein AVEN_114072-1 [Araneus ventricosus]|uniref:Uncharacterized protein n=1 Tax=Araneus ventricosus TaxID=182803 RepID=A0A4Y2K914_ARAVE|nr:hypothetical protein AVEN_114072-1 [Araneus ventricosus]
MTPLKHCIVKARQSVSSRCEEYAVWLRWTPNWYPMAGRKKPGGDKVTIDSLVGIIKYNNGEIKRAYGSLSKLIPLTVSLVSFAGQAEYFSRKGVSHYESDGSDK